MNWTILIVPSFLKDLASLPAKVRGRVERFVFVILPAAANPQSVGKVEKLQGFPDYFKVRIGQYRLGLRLDKVERQVLVLRVLHRREIYRHFP